MPRFGFIEDDSDEDDAKSDSETLHQPLGFRCLNNDYVGIPPWKYSGGQSRYFFDEDDDDDDTPFNQWKKEPPIGQSTQLALLSAHVNTDTVPMKTLIKYAREDDAASIQRNKSAARHSSLILDLDQSMNELSLMIRRIDGGENRVPNPVPVDMPSAYLQLGERERQIKQEMLEEKRRYDTIHESNRRDIRVLLEKEQREVQYQEEQQRLADERVEAARQQELRRQQEKEMHAQQQLERQYAAEAKVASEQKARLEQQQEKERKQAEQVAARQQQERAATEYLSRADKMVQQLKQIRASLEPFENSKPMAKRRLTMKKVVNGKVNTLSEDAEKIRSVAAEVSAAITQAKEEDNQIAEMIKAGKSEYTPEMTKGKRYFVDLLCSKVIVRVQAEGFNGQRGDGFPLAHMLAIVAAEHKDVAPLLAGHLYTVCPTGIPCLPTPSEDATEEELMNSLGMLKLKDGNYETFERFLSRTEGLISMLSNIMSSEPADHPLFGGHQGAIKWLARFLGELPSPPISPLPLITAPVLDAFLTGAGHMLANAYPDEFKKCLEKIQKECVPRLDEGAVGKPSATRLCKTLEGGFEGFKTVLPSRALGELYHGSTVTGHRRPASSAPGLAGGERGPSPFGGGSGGGGARVGGSMPPNPFGATVPAPSPFGAAPQAPNPFGAATPQAPAPFGAVTPASTSFGGAATPQAPTPFGTAAPTPTPFGGAVAQAPFGGAAPTPSVFGGAAPAPSPFGSAGAPGPSLFGGGMAPSTPFGGGTAPPQSQFSGGLFQAAAPAPSSFGFGQEPDKSETMQSDAGSDMFGSSAPSASTFGGQSTFGGSGPGQSYFGGAASSAPSFGTSQGSAPFGAPAPVPFGSPSVFGGGPTFGALAPSPSPFGTFGGSQAPAPFGSPGLGVGGFGAPPSTPFSAGAPSPSPFGTLGAAPAPSPFGGGSTFGAPAPSPFGSFSGAPASGGFGSPPGQTGYGGGFGGFGNSGFGGNVTDNRPPCKFFARGECRYGTSCKFSHEAPSGGGGANSFSNPFGGPRR